MKITKVRSWSEDLELSRPYSIAYETINSVENLFVCLELENGIYGMGAGSPADFVTGENIQDSRAMLDEKLERLFGGKDIRLLREHCRNLEKEIPGMPAARAAADIALYDAFAKHLGIPLVDLLGRMHQSLPTSITIGIKSIKESILEAKEYMARGFKILKVKTGRTVEEDIERLIRIRETTGPHIKIRVDANQGYTLKDLHEFVRKTSKVGPEFIEQPLKKEQIQEMVGLPDHIRENCVADESLIDVKDALRLAAAPKPFGIYNIKLMKCGGITPAVQIAEIARLAGIDLMWGCMDESVISISAALHTALASPATKYLDLDGSLDLARDIAENGFVIKEGSMSVTDQSGLGTNLTVNAIE